MVDHPLTVTQRLYYNRLNAELGDTSRLNEENLTEEQVELFSMLSEVIKERYYGTGMKVPEKLEGKRVLDIGCGSGSLVFMLSKLVGPSGYVVGIDISDGMLQTAQEQSEFHTKLWGYDKPNFEFKAANVERLIEEGFQPNTFDIIVVNGTFCLVPDKERAFNNAFSLLKEGGQFYLSDVYAEKDAPTQYRDHERLWSMGVTGSMRWDTLASVAVAAGFTTPYLTCASPVNIAKEEFKQMLGNYRYACAGWRLFKLAPGETRAASSVTYHGNIRTYPDAFPWDIDLTFKKGKPVQVDGELATVLARTYFSDSFTFADASGNPVTNRNQNPFKYMDHLKESGKLPATIYDIQ